jgi:hypothetical protein
MSEAKRFVLQRFESACSVEVRPLAHDEVLSAVSTPAWVIQKCQEGDTEQIGQGFNEDFAWKNAKFRIENGKVK